MNLYLTKAGRLRRKDNTLSFEMMNLPEEQLINEEESPELEYMNPDQKHALPVETIDAIYVFNEMTFNSKLVTFLGQKKIPVHFFNYFGNHCNTLLPHAEQLSGDLVIRQSQAYLDNEKRLSFCRSLLDATFHNILSVLQYYQRRKSGLENEIERVKTLSLSLSECHSPDQMMGIEGNVRNVYYSAWKTWLGAPAKNFKRVYHPPDNPLNALISFLNSLLYTTCVSEMYRTALYPGISYLHTPQTRRFSLALDLVEPFKPIIVDRLIFRLLGHGEISDKDFRPHTNGMLMTEDARKRVLTAWDEQLRQTVDYPALKRSVSYRRLLRLDCYKLIKFLLEDQEFKPYRIKY
ncbi:MAG: type I-B CRISPR-associated endonuclease Cas1b [Candidatus Thermoplasmatota archaeon]|nr:type I-B CRISPR-associated endonuclease Cas1b [Candidatus Thermoplasmatota archaeon]